MFRGARFRGRGRQATSNIRRQLFKEYDTIPEKVILLGQFKHPCDNDLVVKSNIKDIPYFNAPVFLENKQLIGKVDEIFGTVTDYYVSVRLSENIAAHSFQTNQKLFIDPMKLLPLQRFLQKDFRSPGFRRGRGQSVGRFNNRHRQSPSFRGTTQAKFGWRGVGRGGQGGHFNNSQRRNYQRRNPY